MELSTNLTSKRTSHKIAEQGRRNRINSALQEIATLLPRGPGTTSGSSIKDGGARSENGELDDVIEGTPVMGGEWKGGSGAGGGKEGGAPAAQSSNSKASTVELAIEYIKQLQLELREAKERAESAETRLAAGS